MPEECSRVIMVLLPKVGLPERPCDLHPDLVIFIPSASVPPSPSFVPDCSCLALLMPFVKRVGDG